jgi:hypothetical protein
VLKIAHSLAREVEFEEEGGDARSTATMKMEQPAFGGWALIFHNKASGKKRAIKVSSITSIAVHGNKDDPGVEIKYEEYVNIKKALILVKDPLILTNKLKEFWTALKK